VALAGIWIPSDSPVGMSQPTLTVIVVLAAALLLAVWWLFFSRTGFLTRLASTLVVVAFAGTASLLVEYRGLSGDLVPQIGWRTSVIPRDSGLPGPEGSAGSPSLPLIHPRTATASARSW
jgi:hypothetical protein